MSFTTFSFFRLATSWQIFFILLQKNCCMDGTIVVKKVVELYPQMLCALYMNKECLEIVIP